MKINLKPVVYTIDPAIAKDLIRIEAAKEQVKRLLMNPIILSSLKETAKLYTTHYSTAIEGNQLNPLEIKQIVVFNEHIPGKQRDKREVQGYYAALTKVEEYAAHKTLITEQTIQLLHALVISNGSTHCKPTPYRDGQNVIRDGATGAIVYLPPEASDVPILTSDLVHWIQSNNTTLPIPIVAAIAHYQFATIHPYYDGNGRTARLLTTLILHLGGYDLKGLYSLEEYYARNLLDYYKAINIGPSHNYYLGRAESDITPWIEYFIKGMAFAVEKVVKQMIESEKRGEKDLTHIMRKLDPKQRKALELFREYEIVTSSQIGELFCFKPRTAAALCQKWVSQGFIEIADPSLKGRKYRIAPQFEPLLDI